MTDLQVDSLLTKLDRIATAMELLIATTDVTNPIKQFVNSKAAEQNLIVQYGVDLVNAWKTEAIAVETAKAAAIEPVV